MESSQGMKAHEVVGLVDGCLVIEHEAYMTVEQKEYLSAQLSAAFPDRKIVVLDGGLRIVRAQEQAMARIEAKLDALLDALAQDEGQEPAYDLEGNRLRPDRPEHDTL